MLNPKPHTLNPKLEMQLEQARLKVLRGRCVTACICASVALRGGLVVPEK